MGLNSVRQPIAVDELTLMNPMNLRPLGGNSSYRAAMRLNKAFVEQSRCGLDYKHGLLAWESLAI